MVEVTHEKLVKKARGWLFRHHGLVISEMASAGGEQTDAIGFSTGYSTLVECKVSRSDFAVDMKKYFRRFPDNGMGNNRYYFTTPGLIKLEDLPSGWGLLELRGEKIFKLRESGAFLKNARAEIALLVSALRRVDGHGPGVSVKHYSVETKNRAVVLVEKETA